MTEKKTSETKEQKKAKKKEKKSSKPKAKSKSDSGIKSFFSKLLQKNKFQGVLEDYKKLAQAHPEDMRIQLKIAETYFKAREFDHAIKTYEKIAEHYSEKNFILKAVAVYQRILKLNPNLVEINLKLSDLYQKLDMKDHAAIQLRIAMEVYKAHHESDALIEIAKKLVDLDPSPQNIRKLGEIYHSQGKTNEAIEQYQKLAQTYQLRKEYDELLRICELILNHQPQNRSLIKDVCLLYLRKKEPEKSIRILERYKVDNEPEFKSFYEKAKLMQRALKKNQAPNKGA